MKTMDFETALSYQDFSSIYDTNDPNVILDIILANVNSALDIVAPLKEIKFRSDKPRLNLRKDTLAAMKARNKARKSEKRTFISILGTK